MFDLIQNLKQNTNTNKDNKLIKKSSFNLLKTREPTHTPKFIQNHAIFYFIQNTPSKCI